LYLFLPFRGRILAKRCTAAGFFDYFFELQQKSNEVKITNIRLNLPNTLQGDIGREYLIP
jgi:hypothetical protein